jgi:hypothetical protein
MGLKGKLHDYGSEWSLLGFGIRMTSANFQIDVKLPVSQISFIKAPIISDSFYG